jgi:hypothetical protein
VQWEVIDVEQAKGNFTHIRARIKQRWRRLPEEEIGALEECAVNILAEKLQEHYGWHREEAERQVREFRTRHDWH